MKNRRPVKSRSISKTLKIRGLKVLHFLVAECLFILCWKLYYYAHYATMPHLKGEMILYALYGALLLLLIRIYDAYSLGYRKISDNVYSQTLAQIIAAGVIWLVSLLMYMKLTNPLPLLALCAVQSLWSLIWCRAARAAYSALYMKKRTVVIYEDEKDLRRLKEVGRLEHMFNVQGYIKDPTDYKALEPQLEEYEAIVVSGVNATLRNGIAKYCIERGISGYFAPHVGDIIMQGARHMQNFSVPIMSVRRAAPVPEYLFVKRAFDVLVSGLCLLIFSPVIGAVALAVKAYDGGPALYKQVRLTKDGREFRIIKFRSMRVDAEKDGVARLSSGERDDRITPVGKVIRACRLDELPQLWNILRGDMTIVGPRPERPEIAEQYEQEMPAFSLRLQVTAGLTGYAQVYGKYNTDPYDKLQMDLMYINKMSITEDLRLMLATVRILFSSKSTEGVSTNAVTALDYEEEDQVERAL